MPANVISSDSRLTARSVTVVLGVAGACFAQICPGERLYEAGGEGFPHGIDATLATRAKGEKIVKAEIDFIVRDIEAASRQVR